MTLWLSAQFGRERADIAGGSDAPADEPEPIGIALVGGGQGGAALFDLLRGWPRARVAVVIDPRPDAPAVIKAKSLGIPTASHHSVVFDYPVSLVLEATGRPEVLEALLRARSPGVEVIGAGALRFFWDLLQNLEHTRNQLMQSQKMEAVGQLTGGIAHDFNNLMTVIAGRVELLIRRAGQDERQLRDLGLTRKASARATALVGQLLAFSRRQVLKPRVLDLNSVVEGTRPMLERLIREDIRLVAVLGSDLGRVRVDPGQIEQVIINLVVNARDAMPQGGRLTLETSNVELHHEDECRRAGVEPGSYVMLSVSDTGCGMDADTRSRIFEPFFTTKAPGEGTGLGLSTVYGIVKQSGGGIWVDSERGRGTTFRIHLPRVDKPLEVVAAAQPPLEARGGTETILLVEDDGDLRALAREILQSNGYVVLEANDERARAGAAPAVRAPRNEALYMSGYVDNLAPYGLREQDALLLPKPFTPDKLVRTVREVLDR